MVDKGNDIDALFDITTNLTAFQLLFSVNIAHSLNYVVLSIWISLSHAV